MQNEITRAMGPLTWALLIALSILWGGSFFFVGVALDALPPFTIVALRVGLAALALNLVVVAVVLRIPTDLRTWAAFFAMGLVNNAVPFSLIVWGQTHIASGLASILNATTPLFTVVVAHVLTSDEKMSRGGVAGVLVGVAGVVVMIGPEMLGGLGTNVVAQIAVLGASLAYALAGVFGRRFWRMGVAPLLTATGQVTASTLLLIPVALVVDRPWTLAAPGRRDLGRRGGAGAALDGTRLCPLFPHPGERRRDEPASRDLPDPGQRHRPRREPLGRAA